MEWKACRINKRTSNDVPVVVLDFLHGMLMLTSRNPIELMSIFLLNFPSSIFHNCFEFVSTVLFFAISAFRWAQSPQLLFSLKANFTINQFLCSIWQTRNYSHIKQSHSKTLCPSPWCQKNANSFRANQPHKMEKWEWIKILIAFSSTAYGWRAIHSFGWIVSSENQSVSQSVRPPVRQLVNQCIKSCGIHILFTSINSKYVHIHNTAMLTITALLSPGSSFVAAILMPTFHSTEWTPNAIKNVNKMRIIQ